MTRDTRTVHIFVYPLKGRMDVYLASRTKRDVRQIIKGLAVRLKFHYYRVFIGGREIKSPPGFEHIWVRRLLQEDHITVLLLEWLDSFKIKEEI